MDFSISNIIDYKPIEKKALTCLIIGSKMSGKTTLINNLINNYNLNKSNGIVLTTNRVIKEYINNGIPEECIHYSDFRHCYLLLEKQKNLIKKHKDWSTGICHLNLVEPAYIVIEEYDSIDLNNQILNEIISLNRHYRIYVFISIIRPYRFTPNIRLQMDNVFIFPDTIEQNRKDIYNYYTGFLPSLELSNEILDSLDTYQCLVYTYYNENRINRNIEDILMKYTTYDINEKARIIQRKWYEISSNPYHPIGKRIIQRKCKEIENYLESN